MPFSTLTPSNLLPSMLLRSNAVTAQVTALALATGGLALSGQSALAQRQVSINRDANTGAVVIDQNAFDLSTGELTNTSNIPLPGLLPTDTTEGQPLPSFVPGQLAPNSIDITTDFDFINRAFTETLNQGEGGLNYTLDRDSLTTTTEFDINYVPGDHSFGEGIQVTVFDQDGNVVQEPVTRFVRGDGVTVGPNGETLPDSGQINVTSSASDRIELRILNIRENGAAPSESGVYFTNGRELIAEDLQDGGDRDFDDGEYLDLPSGQGEAAALEEATEISTETTEDETPLEPEIRRESLVENEEIETTTEISEDIIAEDRDFGSVEVADTLAERLGHAVGKRTEDGDLLVYDRYSSTGRVQAGSDGLGVTGQLRPLFGNPKAPPTLLSADATFDPFVGDNEAGFTTTLGITQFLTRTHRTATDVLGNEITALDSDDRLLEPTGLFNNRRMVGYVPARGDRLTSENGVFTLPQTQQVVIEPPSPQAVGRGDAAYTDNVGGFILEDAAGNLTFVPQWTQNGYEQNATTLERGEVSRIIYALVPQQAGQNLQLGQTYPLARAGAGYRTVEGGFTVISADRNPENFYRETAEVYTVEDTLSDINNAATAVFNGIRGLYVEPSSNELVPTVDPDIAPLADARVGNELRLVSEGQNAYSRTTRAAGLYIGGALTGGIGNQEDTITRVRSTVETATDSLRTLRRTNTFSTPRSQVISSTIETTTTTERDGQATFNIDDSGRLQQVEFTPISDVRETGSSTRELNATEDTRLGEEVLTDSFSEETVEEVGSRIVSADESIETDTDTSANASPIFGEIALGGVMNFGNTPWSPAANTVRAELFARDTVVGRSSDDSEIGWRAQATFHPFGENRREGYQYDEFGNLVPLYQTEPDMDENGQQKVELLMADSGDMVEVPVSKFVLDENGDRIPQEVGTGRPKGPGIYLRVEDAFDDGDGAVVDGGLQFTF